MVAGTTSSTYTVRPIIKGVEQTAGSKPAAVLAHDYLEIAKPKRLSNDGKTDVTDVYQPNDATIADVDGDGEMELIVKELCTTDDPKNKPDGPDFDRIEVFKLNGDLLWWIDCGPNLCDLISPPMTGTATARPSASCEPPTVLSSTPLRARRLSSATSRRTIAPTARTVPCLSFSYIRVLNISFISMGKPVSPIR